jgi:hypothetical protein
MLKLLIFSPSALQNDSAVNDSAILSHCFGCGFAALSTFLSTLITRNLRHHAD